MGCCEVRRQGAKPTLAAASQRKQRRQRALQRLYRVRSAVTQKVTPPKQEISIFIKSYAGQANGQLRFLDLTARILAELISSYFYSNKTPVCAGTSEGFFQNG